MINRHHQNQKYTYVTLLLQIKDIFGIGHSHMSTYTTPRTHVIIFNHLLLILNYYRCLRGIHASYIKL